MKSRKCRIETTKVRIDFFAREKQESAEGGWSHEETDGLFGA
jgi:hypothetical protein